MNKKVLVSLLIIGLAAAAIVGGTLAWFTAQSDPIENVFTAGTVEIEAGNEVAVNPEGFDFGNWNPGDEVTLTYTITNTGTKAIKLRALVEGEWENGITGDVVSFDISNNNWTKDNETDNCYYYYASPINGNGNGGNGNGNEVTLTLNVKLEGTAGNEYQGKNYTLGVTFQAIQASHEKTAEGDGWEWSEFDTYHNTDIIP